MNTDWTLPVHIKYYQLFTPAKNHTLSALDDAGYTSPKALFNWIKLYSKPESIYGNIYPQ